MEGRFIGYNGLLAHLIMQQARADRHPGIGLMLDQEKAYDRVHPQYLDAVLTKFGFSSIVRQSIQKLFFTNLVQVNVNGHFTDNVHQGRGLRQGDPLSPILFNLVLEPLLLAIQQDDSVTGFQYYTVEGKLTQIKTIAYADDICVMLNHPSDYDRLNAHLQRYSRASNAKFNSHKTEAFSLSGRDDSTWERFFQDHHIEKYYNHFQKENVIRYLGYNLIYTVDQRRYQEQLILQQVETLLNIYGQRQLSLRGRVTVMNTLILSKFWYVLRLFNPTKAFFQALRKKIYGYVWQHKRPYVAFDQLCLPLKKGGVGLLNPEKQHMVLQKKFLDLVFDQRTIDTHYNVVSPLLLKISHQMNPDISLASISFFIPELRKREKVHDTSFVNVLFRSFDHFDIDFNIESIPVSTLLELPLTYFFEEIPQRHWMTRKSKTLAKEAFYYCPTLKALRYIRRTPMATRAQTRLCNRLASDIYISKILRYKQGIRRILDSPEVIDSTIDTSLHAQLVHHELWRKFNSKNYRIHRYNSALQRQLPISGSKLKKFWSAKMLLPARQVWYRALCNKIPHGEVVLQMKITESATCRVCKQGIDNFDHFLVMCCKKEEIWQAIFAHYCPSLDFDSASLLEFIKHLIFPNAVGTVSDQYQFFTLVSTAMYLIWTHHWACVIDNDPFITSNIINLIKKQIDILLQV